MPAHILIVEDDPLSLMLLRDLLEYRGHRIDSAVTIPEARLRLRAAIPDLVLLDIQVPGGGGELLLHELRADPVLADLTVVAVTAQNMDGDREHLLAAGFDGYLSKPIDLRALVATVDALASRRPDAGAG